MNRITAWLRRFMAGRYGTDKLNMAILGVGLVCAIITMFVSNPFVALTLTFLSYGCMIWAIFRSFSRNVFIICKIILHTTIFHIITYSQFQ
jgi:hypothetical protein